MQLDSTRCHLDTRQLFSTLTRDALGTCSLRRNAVGLDRERLNASDVDMKTTSRAKMPVRACLAALPPMMLGRAATAECAQLPRRHRARAARATARLASRVTPERMPRVAAGAHDGACSTRSRDTRQARYADQVGRYPSARTTASRRVACGDLGWEGRGPRSPRAPDGCCPSSIAWTSSRRSIDGRTHRAALESTGAGRYTRAGSMAVVPVGLRRRCGHARSVVYHDPVTASPKHDRLPSTTVGVYVLVRRPRRARG